MDIKEAGHEDESIKAQDIKREGAEGFAAADILGELFNNGEAGEADAAADEAVSDESDLNEEDASVECGADIDADRENDDNIEPTSCDNDESADEVSDGSEVTATENGYDNATLSDDGDTTEDGQIAIDLCGPAGDENNGNTAKDEITDAPNEDTEADGVSEENAAVEADNTDESESAIPSPDEISEGEKEPEELDEELERERFYQETRDREHTERLSPTPALELTEATLGKEEATEQLSIFDIKAQAGEPKGKKLIGNIFDFLELFVFTLAVVVLLLSFFFRHSVVDGDSMLGTLHNGEHLIISDLFYSPSRGDIVVFEDHSTGFKKPLIKRIIGVGGDEIRISGKKVYLNGELLEEDYVYVDGYQNDASIVLVVPEGELFVMGDHRNESSDSRMFGTISEDAVIGRVVLRFYPFDKFGAVD